LRHATLLCKVEFGVQPEPALTTVEKYFFTPIYHPRSSWSVIRWWESRRPFFNTVIGAAGLLTLGISSALATLPPHPQPFALPWGAVLVYGLMANLCYSAGAPIDLMLRRRLGDRAPAVGQALFRYGFVFSLGLTLLPIVLVAVGWVMRWFIG
jgi:hypothetical protein